jgi:predicted transglutaminase-like cysteine proteinase
MHKTSARFLAVLVIWSLAAGCQTMALDGVPAESTKIWTSSIKVSPPAGFIPFCLKYLDQCTASDEGPETIRLDQATWGTLNAVNYTVNRNIRYRDDLDHYSQVEHWDIGADGYGDCDDYALAKRMALIEAGLPMRALRIAIVRTDKGIDHAVLTAATDRGDYVLDNRTSRILPWEATSFTWIARQDALQPLSWISLRRNVVQQSSDGKES